MQRTEYSHMNKVNVKCALVQALRLCTGRTAHRGSRVIALLFHDHGTRRGWGSQRHAPAALYPRERRGTHCTKGWVGPRAGLDRCGKSRPPPGFDRRTVQPVASRYTSRGWIIFKTGTATFKLGSPFLNCWKRRRRVPINFYKLRMNFIWR